MPNSIARLPAISIVRILFIPEDTDPFQTDNPPTTPALPIRGSLALYAFAAISALPSSHSYFYCLIRAFRRFLSAILKIPMCSPNFVPRSQTPQTDLLLRLSGVNVSAPWGFMWVCRSGTIMTEVFDPARQHCK
ncbi:hypothetical protein NEOLEDRAFT_1128725 [Neolentinus lepideus HHB14362 ss-1]|uniref:Uncharacterized protein n=1 Tax=Neolentinus lepideus HHB14362 ss-1 TaxID=1314782 RepID=A0A165V4J1_9AGAM|nr:hypothetical protein NEOLEDRAFT_1128725 [Neolentinus lepideus HHB14362 ss-1]